MRDIHIYERDRERLKEKKRGSKVEREIRNNKEKEEGFCVRVFSRIGVRYYKRC